MTNVSMRALLEAGVHFGHQTHKWNPKMAKYIYGSRNNIHIIDLQKTVKELNRAMDFIKEVAANGKQVLFVGTKKQALESVISEARRCGSPYVHERWLGGMLTNFATIKKSIKKYVELEKMQETGVFKLLSKKEASRRDKERKRLVKTLEGIRNMEQMPGCLFIVDIVQEATAVKEANKMGIPIVAICDTNSDPNNIDYPIPGNDDAIRAVRYFCSVVADVIIEGKQIASKQEIISEEEAEKSIDEGAGSEQAQEIETQQKNTENKPEGSQTDDEAGKKEGDTDAAKTVVEEKK